MSLSLLALRHSTAEVLAYAVCDLFPGALLANSVSSDIGFYYDFILSQPVDENALPLIEERMRALIKKDLPITLMEMMRENATNFLLHHEQTVKAEIIAGAAENIVSLFKIGDFIDFCPTPYLQSTGEIGAFKLQSIELIPEEELTVTRIWGTAFPNPMALKQFLKRAEQAKKRDHRQLGLSMHLYSFQGDESTGFWLWEPKGALLRKLLLECWRSFPSQSGKTVFSLQGPLTLPIASLHAQIFNQTEHDQRELPIRYHECILYQNENVPLHLFNTRTCTAGITQTFCTHEQIFDELISCLQFIDKLIKIFGFEHHWYLSVPNPPQGINRQNWKQSIALLKQAFEACHLDYILDTEQKLLYCPRAEVGIADALGREWRGSYIAVDSVHPERLSLKYRGIDGREHTPMMMTQSLFGSLERFIALLVEHYGGAFPLWLAPEQVRVVPVGQKVDDYAKAVHDKIMKAGLRCGIDYRLESLGEKVHRAELEKIPQIVVIGDREANNGSITVRSCKTPSGKVGISLEQFIHQLCQEGATQTLVQRMTDPV